ncbi:hypothetical protein [Enterovirga aerilata]|uniref:Uncharacterized protein n=1 Tax=Enterovirga aerilata TaxID=2730920 RepID=A0A849I3S0_9HYPH|nr:hypothetical protein [Enterovirga sp. DB1703]NNM71015.1 hypothetical protein [Enterovirga sp. DB1703]
MRPALLGLLAALAASGPAAAQDRCADFAWPLTRERTLLSEAPAAENGATLPFGEARRIAAVPLAQAGLHAPPERGGPDIRAAHVQVDGAPARIQVTLSDDAWVDVVQGGRHLRSLGSTGHRGCPGLRKSVRFDTGGAPFAVQVSGPDLREMAIAVTAAQ